MLPQLHTLNVAITIIINFWLIFFFDFISAVFIVIFTLLFYVLHQNFFFFDN